MKKGISLLISIVVSCFSTLSFATPDPAVVKLFNEMSDKQSHLERAVYASEQLLDRPYVGGNCGEGEAGCYDKDPLYRLDQFDCTTFVETVLAFAFSRNYCVDPQEEFLGHLKNIKYVGDPISFMDRNHFASIQWIPNAISKGYLKDVTEEIDPPTPVMTKMIDLQGWYANHIQKLMEKVPADSDQDQKLSELLEHSPNETVSSIAQLHYVPTAKLLSQEIQDRIKAKKILVFNLIKYRHIKKPMPDIVSHQGFVIEKDGVLFFRHASPSAGINKTLDMPLNDYIVDRVQDTTWTTLGMNFMELVE